MLYDSAPPVVAALEVRSWFTVVGLVVDYRGACFHLVPGVCEWQTAFTSTAVELTPARVLRRAVIRSLPVSGLSNLRQCLL